MQHPYGLALFEDWLYWTDWNVAAVLKYKRGNTTAMTVQADLTLPLVIQYVQAPGEEWEGEGEGERIVGREWSTIEACCTCICAESFVRGN